MLSIISCIGLMEAADPLNPPLQIRFSKKMTESKFCEIAQMLLNFIKLAGWQLFGVAIGWMKIFPGWELSGWEIFGWQFSGWEFSWVGVVRVGIFRVGVFLDENFPGGNFAGWELSK